jgi:hypothetical protein
MTHTTITTEPRTPYVMINEDPIAAVNEYGKQMPDQRPVILLQTSQLKMLVMLRTKKLDKASWAQGSATG